LETQRDGKAVRQLQQEQDANKKQLDPVGGGKDDE
jgi:hypothetical protein